ncbi:hypothetical protein F4804DRAFT_166039 [Jackrogersella minutella]|nr:hypothetical protein F4804DRAFT_166039 [Jackrogersella minutella]
MRYLPLACLSEYINAMAGAPTNSSSPNPAYLGAVVTALCVTLAVLIIVGAIRMRRSSSLSMVREINPRGNLPGDQVDSIPIVKYVTAKRKCLAGEVSQTGTSNIQSQAIDTATPTGDVKGTVQRYWSKIYHPETSNTTEHPARDVQQACPTCTEDFLDDDDVRLLPCKHLFHPRCIDPWFKSCAITCPLWQVSQLNSIT